MYELKVISGAETAERFQSTIQFPYSDIEDAIAVATGLMKGGGIPLSRDQLAAAMGLVPNSGGFGVKLGTARAFQVIESKDGKYQLTELGFEIVDAARQKAAMVKAFLSVELYKRTYDEFRGKQLPPRPLGLEAAFVNFGVSPKQKERARNAFDKSARAAGFFPNGSDDRLVMPFGTNGDGSHPPVPPPITAEADIKLDDATGAVTVSRAPVSGLHRSILGMLDELPPAKSEWSMQEQADWLQALAGMFRVLYKSEDKGEIEVRYTP